MRANKQLVLNDLSNLLKTRLSDNLKDVVLFGSHALGKAHPDSDYDFLIILKHKADWKTEREISALVKPSCLGRYPPGIQHRTIASGQS